MIYLDNAATTKVDPRVFEAMTPWLTDEYGNAGSIHQLGRRAHDAVEHAREQVASLIGASPEQIIFTASGSEANNMAINCIRNHPGFTERNKILTTEVEHDSVLAAIDQFYVPYNVLKVPIQRNEDGTLEYVEPDFDLSDVGMVSVMLSNNEVHIDGAYRMRKLMKELKANNDAYIFGDAVQALGSISINVNTSHKMYDAMSFSGHKLHAPKGIGALFVRDKTTMFPLVPGSGKQEFGLRAGTENVAGIVGFGAACELAKAEHIERTANRTRCVYKFHMTLMYEAQRHGILKNIRKNGSFADKILSYTIDCIDSESLILLCDSQGVCISAGSACTDHSSEPSHVLLALGMNEAQARSTIRVSFSFMNTTDEAVEAAKIIASCASFLLKGCVE